MVAYIRSDLEFILAQIKIAEDHALYEQSGGTLGKPLFGVGSSGQAASIPTYNLSWGLRTVDGSLNHLLPGQEHWGASDGQFPELVPAEYRTVMVTPPGSPTPVPVTYTPGANNGAGPGNVFDPTPRTISNLLVDQTLGNPAAIVTSLTRNGIAGDLLAIAATIMAAYAPLKPLFKAVDDTLDAYSEAQAAADVANPPDPALDAAAAAAQAALLAAQQALADARALDPDGAGPGVRSTVFSRKTASSSAAPTWSFPTSHPTLACRPPSIPGSRCSGSSSTTASTW